jgi:hypothetical protein
MTEHPQDSDARSLSPVNLDPEFEDEAFLPGFRVVNHRLLGAFPYQTGGEAKVNATLDGDTREPHPAPSGRPQPVAALLRADDRPCHLP